MNKQPYEATNGNYLISTNPALIDMVVVHQYLSQESYWAKHIPFKTVQTSIHNSLCFGVYEGKRQVGFARLITDMACFAYLADVFILEGHRGKGLSKWLMQTMQAHPELQGLRRWMLATKDAHGLYQQFGWKPFTGEDCERLMQLHNPNVYH